jgi:ribosomal protein L32E
MTPSGHKAFLVSNVNDVELLLMHNRTYAAEYVSPSTFLHLNP